MKTLTEVATEMGQNILRIIEETTQERKGALTLDTRLDDEDFGIPDDKRIAKSTERELIGKALAEEYGIIIPLDIYEKAKTYGDLVRYILSQA